MAKHKNKTIKLKDWHTGEIFKIDEDALPIQLTNKEGNGIRVKNISHIAINEQFMVRGFWKPRADFLTAEHDFHLLFVRIK